MGKRDHFVGIDVGSKKVVCLIGRKGELEELNIIGIGVRESRGVKNGVIIDLDATAGDIEEAVKEAETMAYLDVEEALVSISGAHLQSLNSLGTINVMGKEKITSEDVDRLLVQARSIAIPNDREILYVLPQEYTLDSQSGIVNPVGMTGTKLDIKVHIITALSAAVHNLTTCINKAGVGIKAIIPSYIAAAETTLNADEKELGVALLDVGEGTSDIAFFEKGSLWSSFVMAIGGNYFTRDIAIGLRTSIADAEKIKRRYGTLIMPGNRDETAIKIPSVGSGKEKTIPIDILIDILSPRAEELLGIFKQQIGNSGSLKYMNAGVVITGGCANLKGLDEKAENVFGLPSRVGCPGAGIEGLLDRVRYPEFSVAVGLLFLAARQFGGGQGTEGNGLLSKMRSLFERF